MERHLEPTVAVIARRVLTAIAVGTVAFSAYGAGDGLATQLAKLPGSSIDPFGGMAFGAFVLPVVAFAGASEYPQFLAIFLVAIAAIFGIMGLRFGRLEAQRLAVLIAVAVPVLAFGFGMVFSQHEMELKLF